MTGTVENPTGLAESVVGGSSIDYAKAILGNDRRKKALEELSAANYNLGDIAKLTDDQFNSLSLETQDYIKTNMQEPNFFQKNAGMISAGADILGGLAGVYGAYKQGQLMDTQMDMAKNELAFNKERQANFRSARSGFNARPTTRQTSALVG